MKFQEGFEGHFVVTNSWECEIGGESIELALHIEVVNMDDATGEKEYKQYPYLFSVQIVAANPHESFNEDDRIDKPSNINLIMDCVSYMGGVPVDDKLLGLDRDNKDMMGELKAKDAKLVSHKQDYGSFAARNGKNAVLTYPQFKTQKACESFAKALVTEYGDVLMGIMIGFTLDAPINMIGEDGWSVIHKQVEGK